MLTVSSQLIASREDYLALRKHWAALVNSDRKHEMKAVHYLIYMILLGRDWRKAFTFPTNKNKVNNGYTPALYPAMNAVYSPYREKKVWEPFAAFVTHDAPEIVRRMMSHARFPKAGSDGHPDCQAYVDLT